MPEPRVLVAYHSADGHTAEIANRIAEMIGKAGASVDVIDAADAPAPTDYDGVVLGDSIHAGRHSRALTTYLTQHLAEVQARPNALFQVSLTSAKTDEKSAAEVRQYVSGLLDRTGFDPDMVGLFAGAVVYTRYGWLKRRMMRRIVSSDSDDTDVSRDYDYTDWAAVEHFAEDVYRLVTSEDQRDDDLDIGIRDLVPRHTAQLEVTAAKDGIGEVFGPGFGRLMAGLAQRGVQPAGPPFARYVDVSDDTAWRIAIGVPVASPIDTTDEVYAGELPGGRAVVAVHHGSYDGIGVAWAAATDWTRTEGLSTASPPWESYVVSDMDGSDPEATVTEIVLPLA